MVKPRTKLKNQQNTRMVKFTTKNVYNQRPSSGNHNNVKQNPYRKQEGDSLLMAAMETMQSSPQANENFEGK